MNCKNCGAELNEGALFCGNCGMSTETEHNHGEYHQESYENYQEQGSYVPPTMPEYATEPVIPAEKPNTVLWIILSAVEIFTCCRLTGIISLIFSIIGHISAEKGDYADAESKLKIAKTSFWIGLGLGILAVVAYIVIIVFLFAAVVTEGVLHY